MKDHPRFIVLEGIDGAGTTTQAALLAEALLAAGTSVCRTAEPSAGPVGRLIRSALRGEIVGNGGVHSLPWSSMALLFAADRLDHVETVIRPALARGMTVVSDRYVLSSLAYQSVTSPEGTASVSWLESINARAPRPDLTIVVDVDPDVAAARRAARGGPKELFEVAEIQKKLSAVYTRAEDLVPGDTLVHVADGSVEEVQGRIWEALTRWLATEGASP